MATKPTKIPDIWASADNYSLGPKVGRPTKTPELSPIGAALEGHIPGKQFPTTANEFNRWCFDISKVAEWVMNGRSDRDISAHVKETDSDGRISATKAYFGGTGVSGPSLFVQESGSGDAILASVVNARGLNIAQSLGATTHIDALTIASNQTKLSTGYLARITNTPATAGNGCGGLYIKTDGAAAIGGGVNYNASIVAENSAGPAATFMATGTTSFHYALRASNKGRDKGPAAYLGWDPADGDGWGTDAVIARGANGNANSSGSWDGGIGIVARGGYGQQGGVVTTDGGLGLWAIGGDAEGSGEAAPAALFWGGGKAAPVVIVEVDPSFIGSGYSAPMLQILCPDGESGARGIEIANEGGLGGIKMWTGRRYAIDIQHNEFSGELYPHLFLNPLTRAPDTASPGALWVREWDGGALPGLPFDQQRLVMQAVTAPLQAATFRSWCHGFGEATSQVVATSGDTILAVDFTIDSVPVSAATVKLEASIVVDVTGSPAGVTESLRVRIIDFTSSVTVVDASTTVGEVVSGRKGARFITVKKRYVLPDAGDRTFRLVLTNAGPGVNTMSVASMNLEITSAL